VTRSILPVGRPRRYRLAALLGALAVLACSFQDFDYLQDGKSGAPGAATGGRNPWDNTGGSSGYQPWQDDTRGGRRLGNWGGATGVGGNVPAGGGSAGGAPAADTGGSSGATESGGAAGA
jgi:hypothetical protein